MRRVAGRACVVLAGLSIVFPASSLGATLHVPADHPTIQACIDAAADGDECVVAPGTYHETINFLGKAITLRSSGGPEVTTIDATGIGGSVVTSASGEGPDTILYGFTITGGTGSYDASLDTWVGGGMGTDHSNPTVTNCTFTANEAYLGGGMSNDYSNPVITNCAFIDNTASYGGGIFNNYSSPSITGCTFALHTYPARGGGIYNFSSSPSLASCTFSSNTGSALYNTANSSPTVTNCAFTDNFKAIEGGAITNESRSSPRLANCTFSRNWGNQGGAICNFLGCSPVVIGCVFRENVGGNHGGAIYNGDPFLAGATRGFHSSESARGSVGPTVDGCAFVGNRATSGGAIGNIFYNGTIVKNSIFHANRAFLGGAITSYESDLTVANCALVGNWGDEGGGIGISGGSAVVIGCTFFGNTSVDRDYGGALTTGSGLTLTNCIVSGNVPVEMVVIEGDTGPTIRSSDIQGGVPIGAIDGGGNIDFDPLFVQNPSDGGDGWGDNPYTLNVNEGANDDFGDLRLQAGSPCINSGDPEFVPQPGETDLDGHPRVLCGRVDMGAYEFGIGDYDCDQVVDLADFAAWADCMTGPVTASDAATERRSDEGETAADAATRKASSGATALAYGPSPLPLSRGERGSGVGCAAFDFNADGQVDLWDFAAFQRLWAVP